MTAPTSNRLTFTVSSQAETKTKTPANVKGDYLSVHHPSVTLPPARKRKSDASASTTASSSKKPRSDNPVPTSVPAPKKPTRQRDPSKKQATARNIPRSLEECGEADRELITLRDGGAGWKDIREKWRQITGNTPAHSTLPNRYNRLKSNFTSVRPEDNPLLLLAKRQVEASFEAQKWDLVAQVVREKGGDVYAGVVLQRQYKKLMVQQGVVPPEGVRDGDWELEALP